MNKLRREGWAQRSVPVRQVLFTKPGFGPIVLPHHVGNGTLRSICLVAGWECPPHR